MTKKQKREVSIRMKAYWARRRAENGMLKKKTKKTRKGPQTVVLGSPEDQVNAARSAAAENGAESLTETPEWKLMVLAHDPNGGIDMSTYVFDGFGEMTDILHNSYLGIPIVRFWVEKNE